MGTLPGTCQTPVGQFCSPAKGHTWRRRNLQTCLGNFCYGERELTFESYTWAGLGSRSSLQLQLDRDPEGTGKYCLGYGQKQGLQNA